MVLTQKEYELRVKHHFPHLKIISEYNGSDQPIDAKCTKHDIEFTCSHATKLSSGKGNKCTGCKGTRNKEEYKLMIKFVKWFRENHKEKIIHFNGMFLSKIHSQKCYELGYCVGMPDIFIPHLKLYIEFKSEKGVLSKKQEDCIYKLGTLGYNTVICRTFESAIKTVN
jgi:hypothetical protein